MAFTREFIRKVAKESGVEIPKEMEDALVQEHLTSRDAYAQKQVKAWEDEHPAEPTVDVKESKEYKDLMQAFDTYKADQDKKSVIAAKEKAYRVLLKECNISEKRIDAIIKVTDLESLELDETGAAFANADELKSNIKSEWADFAETTDVTGDPTPTPHAAGSSTMTKADIYKKDDKGRYILSAAERQKAIAENPEEFGI